MRSKYIIVSLLMFMLACAVALTLYACRGTNKQSGAEQISITTSGVEASVKQGYCKRTGLLIAVKPMDDPENPYRDQYKPWDLWCYDHIVAYDSDAEQKPVDAMTYEEKQAFVYGTNKPTNWIRILPEIEDGFLVPSDVHVQRWEEAIANNQRLEYSTAVAESSVVAEGEIEPSLRDENYLATDAIRASYWPPIPSWLVDADPSRVLLLPNGDVITDGLLGEEHNGSTSGCCGGSKDSLFARYDCSGQLVRTAQGFWWYTYYDLDLQGKLDGKLVNTPDGYIKLCDVETGQVLRAWDYDATEIPAGADLPSRDTHPFSWLSGATLKCFYAATN
ncbi:hypothetical protein JW859_12075 [bacterium]|nr:hypothetical protein [bacterium]